MLLQLSKHSPHGLHSGTLPVVPRAHWSQFLLVTPVLQMHSPVCLLHLEEFDPGPSHSQSKRHKNNKKKRKNSRF
jgi:hypothetical protein